MKKFFFLIIIAMLAAVFSLAQKTNAQEFNGRDSLVDWSKTQNTVFNNSGAIDPAFCQEKLFKFQQDNLFANTFCDLGSIVAISAADFATNATCNIQKVAMGNYDKTVEFSAKQNTCTATNKNYGVDVFGKSSANGSPDSGIYEKNISELTKSLSMKSNDSSENLGWIPQGYKLMRNLATVAALVALMIFAFANILHIDISSYTIKKMIPNIIVAVVGGYLSIYVITILSRGIDFLYRLSIFSPYNVLHPFYNIMGGTLGTTINSSGAAATGREYLDSLTIIFKIGEQILGSATSSEPNVSIIGGILGVIFLTIPAIVVFAFEYVLALRPIVVGLLVIVSPLAFAAYVFPTGQNIFKKWVTITLIALFYTPAVHMILNLMNLLSASTPVSGIVLVLMILVKTAIFVFLIRMPFTVETDIQRITLALSKTNLGASLGLKQDANIKVKQDNRNTVTDRALANKAAKQLIAPTNSFGREVGAIPQQRRPNLSEIYSRPAGPQIKNLGEIAQKAHQNNLSRPASILANSLIDLSPQTIKKIISSSNKPLFSDSAVVKELKVKNGQLLDDEGAMTRADAMRKVFRQAQALDGGRIASPEAVKLMAQKQLLGSLPSEVVRRSLEQGILNRDDIRANFKGDPDKVMNYLAQVKSGKYLDFKELNNQMQRDFYDSKSGFTDLYWALSNNLKSPSRVLETMRTQNPAEFAENGFYYLRRMSEVNQDSKKRLASELRSAGTPAPTAQSLSQNPTLSFEQIASYVPKTASPENLSAIKETIVNRDSSGSMIGQIASSLKEDKAALSRTVAQKVSESFQTGTARSFDDIKGQLQTALKDVSSGNPQSVKQSLGTINNFASGSAMQIPGVVGAEDIQKTKAKGEAVVSTIDEMKMAGIDEKTIMENPSGAADKLTAEVEKTIKDVITGKVELSTKGAPTQATQSIAAAGKDGAPFENALKNIAKDNPPSVSQAGQS